VAAQDAEDPGMLILSRFAGAAAELGAALLVNPYDPETVAASISHALSMSLEERRARHTTLFRTISENDLKNWGELFLAALTRDADLPLWQERLGLQPVLNPDVA
jgi:trehalose 6-phosphate synthase